MRKFLSLGSLVSLFMYGSASCESSISSDVLIYRSISNISTFWEANDGYRKWVNRGVNGKYDPIKDLSLAKQAVMDLSNKTNENSSSTLGLLPGLLGFCRAAIVLNENTSFLLSNKISYANLPQKCKSVLDGHVRAIVEKYKASSAAAQNLALFTAFSLDWKQCIELLKSICPEGAFTHDYNIEEALFILHMCPLTPSFLGRMLDKSYEKNMLFYTMCLAGSIAKVLKDKDELEEGFNFIILTSYSKIEELAVQNIKKLLAKYMERLPLKEKKSGAKKMPVTKERAKND
jgi:hypothetical protein